MEASKQTEVTSRRHAKALVLKLMKRADKTNKWHVRACPQIEEVIKQTDVTSRWHAKAFILKLRK